MPQGQANEQPRQHEKDQAPGKRNPARTFFQIARQHHQQSLPRQHRDPVERIANTDKKGLLLLRKSKHIKTISGDIMRRRAESHQPKEGQRKTQEEIARQGKGHARHAGANQELHRDDPPPLGLDQIDKRAPNRLDHPREIEPARVQRDLGVRDLHPLIHDHGERHHHHIWQSLSEIERGNPTPRMPFFHKPTKTND